MDFLFCKTCTFILFVCVIYFIQIVIGNNNGDNFRSIINEQTQIDCNESIYQTFKIDIETREDVKQYIEVAITHLRYVTDEERAEYVNNLQPGQPSLSTVLLYDGRSGTVFGDRYVHGYFGYMKHKYDTTDVFGPEYWCLHATGERKEICESTLLQTYRFSSSKNEAVKQVFSYKVLRDFGYEGDVMNIPQENHYLRSIFFKDEYFPIGYIIHIRRFIQTSRFSEVNWPEQFCLDHFTEYRH